MQVKHLSEGQSHEWNAFVAQQPGFGLLQSWEWGEFKRKLGWRVSRIAVCRKDRLLAGAQVFFKAIVPGLLGIGYIPRGPVGNWTEETAAALLFAEIHRTARQHRAAFLRMEPAAEDDAALVRFLHFAGFVPSSCTNQPRATLILDIRSDEESLLLQMRHKTRQYIRSAIRNGVTVRFGARADLPAFITLARETARRQHFAPRSDSYYEQEWHTLAEQDHGVLLMAFYHDQLLAKFNQRLQAAFFRIVRVRQRMRCNVSGSHPECPRVGVDAMYRNPAAPQRAGDP